MDIKKWIYELTCNHSALVSFDIDVIAITANGESNYCIKRFNIKNSATQPFFYRKGLMAEFDKVNEVLDRKDTNAMIWAYVDVAYSKLPKGLVKFHNAKINRNQIVGVKFEWRNAESRDLTYEEYKEMMKK